MLKVYRIETVPAREMGCTPAPEIFYTVEATQALESMARYGGAVKISVVEMSLTEYAAIPATSDSAEWFRAA